MSLSPSNLETVDGGTINWNDIHTANMERLNDKLGVLMSSAQVVGAPTVNDAANATQQTLTDSTGGSSTTTLGATGDSATNNNFASILSQIANIKVDIQNIQDKQDEILDRLRASTGVGLIGG